MKICDLIDSRSQKVVTSILYTPADTCHSSVKFDVVCGSQLFLFYKTFTHPGGGGAAARRSLPHKTNKKRDIVDAIMSLFYMIGASA
jgi:hypothetical protein